MSPCAWPALALALLVPIETSFVPVALAQEAPSAADVSDVVMLRDGSMFRGTITELVPADHVDLLLPLRQSRRFAMADVTYAGPVAGAPGAAPKTTAVPARVEPVNTLRDPLVDLRVAANTPDVQLLLRVGQGTIGGAGYAFGAGGFVFGGHTRDYAILCTAPCNVQLPIGRQRFALSREGGAVIETGPMDLRASGTLHATYDSRRGVRAVGLVVLLAGIATGVILLAVGKSTTPCGPNVTSTGPGPCEETHFDRGYVAAGIGVLTVGTVAGLVMLLTRDKASLEFVPTVTSKWLAPRGVEADARGFAPDDSYGLALRLTL